ncbi:MAG TPA: magnesium-translocating P-type ATPase [Polyangiaceae bacterium]|nr:magnesium-translocating P-type ATPase [Polyangiaceae bacterium]
MDAPVELISTEGLDSAEAARRLTRYGPNEPASTRRSPLAQVLPLLGNPLALVLLVASALSAWLGETIDAALIAGLVGFSVIMNLVQTWRSQRAAQALRERVAPRATVLRDGRFCELPRREVVPGDVVRLSAGDLVPADGRLIESRDLHVQQAALTGESLPVEKEANVAADDLRGTVWLGTSIVSGTALARIVATGGATQFGDVVARLASRPPETEFERGLRHFGLLITRTVLVLVLVLLAASLAMHRPPFQSLLFAVALAVGLTPEFLPMITTVTLAQGAARMAREHVIVKHLAAIQNLGSIDVLCSDKTGTLTVGEMRVEGSYDALGGSADRPLSLARLNSRFETGIRSPLDEAVLATPSSDDDGWTKCDEVPFDFERRRVSIVVARHEKHLLVAKGAADGLCALSAHYESGGVERAVDEATRAMWRAWLAAAGERGLRVLGVAFKRVGERTACTVADENDFVFAGFVTFSDPPRADAADAVRALQRDGVSVKIVTGDDEAVARHVCAAVGLDGGGVLCGTDVERMTDGALVHAAARATIFARTSPAQKTRILLALKRGGHVVGFLGDGINDAPSLHAADVGIAAPGAVDVARDAADMLLTERGLSVLHRGIVAGRRAFGNVMKYLLMGTSSNFGNMLSMAVASLMLPFLPMLPSQILLNNVLYDVAQVTIPTDDVDEGWLGEPHKSDIGLVRRFMLLVGPLSSIFDFLTFFVLLRVFHADETLFHTGWFVESLATQTLVLFVIRTLLPPWKSRPSAPLTATVLMIVATGTAIPFTPFARVLGFEPLPGSYFAFLVAVTIAYLALVEVTKAALVRRGAFALRARA